VSCKEWDAIMMVAILLTGTTHLSLSRRLSTVPANSNTADRYTVEVVRMAHIVPIGIDF